MSVSQNSGISGKAAVIGIGAAVVVLVGGYLVLSQRPDAIPPTGESEPAVGITGETATPSETETAATEAPATESTTATAETGVGTEDVGEGGAAEVASEELESDDTAEAALAETDLDGQQANAAQTETSETGTATADAPEIAPRFDVVRIDPQGGTVVAGNAAPGAQISLRVGGEIVADVTADDQGKFVALFDLGPSDAPRSLELLTDGVAVAGGETVLISPISPEPIVVAEAEPEPEDQPTPEEGGPSEETSTGAEQSATGDTSETGQTDTALLTEAPLTRDGPAAESIEVASAAPERSSEPTPTTNAPTVVSAAEEGVRVLQPAPQPAAPGSGPDVTTNVVIDTITYDTGGEVALSGRGQSDGFVRLYLNEEPIQTTSIAPDGSWTADLPDVDAGVYRLRVDEVDAAGVVTSRVETPFKREAPALVEGRIAAVTVQPGFTLWGIAKDRFGDGFQYVRVYEANRDLIRDPDLIYPGQVFTIPE